MAQSIESKFNDFHAANPHIYELFSEFARKLRAVGRTRYSADAILHRIRWHLNVEIIQTDQDSDFVFKINDHYSSRYARMLVMDDPSFAGFFEFRELRNIDGDDTEWSSRESLFP